MTLHPALPLIRPSWRRRASTIARTLAVTLLLLVGACDASARLGGPGSGRSTDGRIDDGVPALIDPDLVGAWRRVLIFGGDSGDLIRSETIWSFRADGSATRFVDVVDFGRGLADSFVSHARWRVVDHTVLIEWSPPMSGTLRLDYRVAFDGESAILGNDRYALVH